MESVWSCGCCGNPQRDLWERLNPGHSTCEEAIPHSTLAMNSVAITHRLAHSAHRAEGLQGEDLYSPGLKSL